MTKPSDRDCRLVSDAFKAAMLELERLSERPPPIPNKGERQPQGPQATVEIRAKWGADAV